MKIINKNKYSEKAETRKVREQIAEELIDQVIYDEYRHFDLHLDGDGVRAENRETPTYLTKHRHEYVRTICDVLEFLERTNGKRILEVGAFFGLVSLVLARLGYEVCASDIPEYMKMKEQIERFGRSNVRMASVRLQDYILPFEDGEFDVIIMCEVLEHLNFNPLPLLKEINRIGAQDSLFYLSLPNLAYYKKRLAFLFGRSVFDPIDAYFSQLDPDSLCIVNGHWREYTGAEIKEMLTRLGYTIGYKSHYYFSIVDVKKNITLRNRLTKLVFAIFPSFKENQTTLAIRSKRTDIKFAIPNTVHPTIESL